MCSYKLLIPQMVVYYSLPCLCEYNPLQTVLLRLNRKCMHNEWRALNRPVLQASV